MCIIAMMSDGAVSAGGSFAIPTNTATDWSVARKAKRGKDFAVINEIPVENYEALDQYGSWHIYSDESFLINDPGLARTRPV